MTAPSIQAVIDLRPLRNMSAEMQARAKDLRQFFQLRLAPAVSSHLEQQYETNGAHLGTPWAPLKVSTIQARTRIVTLQGGALAVQAKPGRAKAGFATPMRDTLRSYLSLTRLVDPEGIRDYQPQVMTWGTRLAYMEKHHRTGGFMQRAFGRGPLVHVPERPVIPKEWPQRIVDEWADWLVPWLTA